MKKILIASLFASYLPLQAMAADDWQFRIEPYGMVTSIDGDADVGRVSGAEVAVDFNTILDNLDMAAMVHFEAHHESGWGVILDYGFMDLSHEKSGRAGVVKASARQGVLEAFVNRRLVQNAGILDIYGGIRWWDNDLSLKVDPAAFPGSVSAKKNPDWVDPVIGMRWTQETGSAWTPYVRGDIGGFGIESDFTWSTAAGVFYRFNDTVSLEIAYKATGVDYEEGRKGTPQRFAYDTITHGPLFGLAFDF
ncbi:MAG: hypothetical protein ABFR19_03690 [Pseudomonadota bacterium]